MKVVWSPLAIERLSEIASFIAKDNPDSADRWVLSVFARVGQVRDFARSGRRVPEVGRIDIRELVHGNYRIIYRIEPKRIAVLTVRHGSQLLRTGEILD